MVILGGGRPGRVAPLSGAPRPARAGLGFFLAMPWIFISRRTWRELNERVDQLAKDMKAIDLDWSSVYDKFRSIVARMAKRAERERAASLEAAESQEGSSSGPTAGQAPEAELPSSPFMRPGLTSHQREMQQRILRRRAGMS